MPDSRKAGFSVLICASPSARRWTGQRIDGATFTLRDRALHPWQVQFPQRVKQHSSPNRAVWQWVRSTPPRVPPGPMISFGNATNP